jgi:hypothetical protein
VAERQIISDRSLPFTQPFAMDISLGFKFIIGNIDIGSGPRSNVFDR